MGDDMKKYIVITLLFCPLMSLAAPAVKKLGFATPAATGGVKSTVAAKVTPARSATVGGNIARVGSLRLNSANSASTSGAISGSSSRFPVVIPSKFYNSVSSPKPTGGTIVNASVDLTEVNNRIDSINSTLTEHDTRINNNDTHITQVESSPKFDSISTVELTGTPPENRAWIWVEE